MVTGGIMGVAGGVGWGVGLTTTTRGKVEAVVDMGVGTEGGTIEISICSEEGVGRNVCICTVMFCEEGARRWQRVVCDGGIACDEQGFEDGG